jgi:nitrite reductase/ring-hydroxylating ferredoxin subunit
MRTTHTHLGEDEDAVALLVKLRQHLVQQKKLARRLHHQSYSLLSGLCLGLVAFKQVRVVAALVGSSVMEEEGRRRRRK